MRMVRLRLNRESREITINPEKVLYVCHYETGASGIHFGKDCVVRVQGEMAEVVAKIEAALHDQRFDAPTAPAQPAAAPTRSDMN